MPEVTIVYWRDIPAQVLVGRGRGAVKRVLSERFEQSIDRAAMASGARDTDAYLAEWRRAAMAVAADSDAAAADLTAARLEADYDTDRLKSLIANGGRGPGG